MTPAHATRPVLLTAMALSLPVLLSACGGVEGEPRRFESMARHVAAIDVPLNAAGKATPRMDARSAGLRPAEGFTPVQVAVMDPHDMWDARDAQAAGLRFVARTAAPVVAEAAMQRVSAVVENVVPTKVEAEKPALRQADVRRAVIQLGAFSSETAARAAWDKVRSGAARSALDGMTPVFEAVQVNGRALTRLKVGPIPVESAAALCLAAQVADPWCRRPA